MKRLKLTISGQVQAVGFRYFVERMALKLGLTGYVKNRNDDKVEVLVEGEEEKLKRMLELCEKGPVLAKVTEVKKRWMNYQGEFDEFEIE
tara:strand:- start:655 stop:924 length:270 start_codon:yes stop_codon:yes gene_type:complete